jgi:hypothetical protein
VGWVRESRSFVPAWLSLCMCMCARQVTARHEKPLKPFDKILPYFVNTMDVSHSTQTHISPELPDPIFRSLPPCPHLLLYTRTHTPPHLPPSRTPTSSATRPRTSRARSLPRMPCWPTS